MLKWLWCLIAGHRFLVPFATGRTIQTTNLLTGFQDATMLYVMRPVPFCYRCGKVNNHYEEQCAALVSAGAVKEV